MHIELVIAKLITVGLGLLITYKAYKGYRTYGSEPMLYVAIGFLFISVGSVIEGVLFRCGGLSMFLSGTIQTGIVALLGCSSFCIRCTDNCHNKRPRARVSMTGHWELALIAVRVLLLGVGLATTAISSAPTSNNRPATYATPRSDLGSLHSAFSLRDSSNSLLD